ncbi:MULTISPECIES: hypothetical protein [unclassified Akkermansia]|uniref:hypothetical protein n=1 Tax=unclassified Akkermansia TaxID=2608915 RepID=UPI00122F5CE9|nr:MULTISPECIES: hypothetical protein [unclassified Akkermansia]KAA3155296.1 hypothetical protein F1995_04900 [Akkermansia sp. BIOML-A62]KAA3164582.1 hypothetical protein F2A23_08725 [Akkermansia sp. BIOML-A63]KAA3184258.1 hypothetical protein F1990_06755 [Akkermansia sp. BIOML-A55]KAA3203484.1 hypothetical protein F1999_07840 [Akkermansia sp. BIOML-A49]KAA3223109.1 hypothetical protein F1985_07115 [Akkermansia sp. BIOML-A41]KAA3228843.1 hypothetical protein F1958_08330 [Akkermansia sp. BIOML
MEQTPLSYTHSSRTLGFHLLSADESYLVFFSINPYCNPNNGSHSGTTSPMEHSKTGMHAKLKAHIIRRLSSKGIAPMGTFFEIAIRAISRKRINLK